MFPNFYQNGSYIEIYNAQSKDLLKNWKFNGKVEKEYDSVIKGYLHNLTVGGVSKMQIPPNDKKSIGVIHNCLLFQLLLVAAKCFTIEISITDSSNTKRRIMLSSSTKETVINSLHCRIPLTNFPIGQWVHFTVNIANIICECFKSQSLRGIDSLILSANCKIKKICSLKSMNEIMQKVFYLPIGIDYLNVFLHFDKLEICIPSKEEMSPNINDNNNNIIKRYNYNKNTKEQKQLRSKSQSKPKPIINKQPNFKTDVPIKHSKITNNNNQKLVPNANEANVHTTRKPNTNHTTKKPAIQTNKKIKAKQIPNPHLNLKDHNPKEEMIPYTSNYLSSKTPNQIYINNLVINHGIAHNSSNSNEKFTNMLNLNNSTSNSRLPLHQVGDSIEEIVDCNDNNGTIIDESLIKLNNIHDCIEKNKYPLNDKEEIDNYQKSLFNKIKLNHRKINDIDENNKNKQELMDEMLNDIPSMSVLESNRPYTPPITKLIPIKIDTLTSKQKLTKAEADARGDLKDSKGTYNNKDIIYDKVLGCYYDPQRNVYFNIKNSDV